MKLRKQNVPILNPGSREAIKAGCTCPVLDNEYGEGAYIGLDGKPLFWIDPDCPLHGMNSDYNN